MAFSRSFSFSDNHMCMNVWSYRLIACIDPLQWLPMCMNVWLRVFIQIWDAGLYSYMALSRSFSFRDNHMCMNVGCIGS